MALKEISVKEALQLIAEKYPEPVEGWFWHDEQEKKDKGILNIDTGNIKYVFKIKNVGYYPHFAIEVPDEHRQLKPEELIALKGKWLKNKTDSIIAMVTGIDSEEGCVNMLGIWWSIKELHESWNHEDGSPLGKIEG